MQGKQTCCKLSTSRYMYSISERIRQDGKESSVMGSCVTKINGIVLSKGFGLSHVLVSRCGNSQFRPESMRHCLPDLCANYLLYQSPSFSSEVSNAWGSISLPSTLLQNVNICILGAIGVRNCTQLLVTLCRPSALPRNLPHLNESRVSLPRSMIKE